MQTMPKTANRPMSSSVEAERPIGNTARNARHPASVVHLTTIPDHESDRHHQVETEDTDERQRPQPHDPREV